MSKTSTRPALAVWSFPAVLVFAIRSKFLTFQKTSTNNDQDLEEAYGYSLIEGGCEYKAMLRSNCPSNKSFRLFPLFLASADVKLN